ncbi:DUF2480 family protein [Flavobacterium tiangeerense]|uniref:DUF2480 family protein n=1 Tax=Flavobacterium tiangeerense TaxID=459471 RepID=UPI0011A2E479|nr:DUF2480 family protein [Flavobacterium tiangeerense]
MRVYILAAHYSQSFVRSIMYGEASSAVPLFKTVKNKSVLTIQNLFVKTISSFLYV